MVVADNSSVKLQQGYSLSWLHPINIWCKLVKFVESRIVLLRHVNLSHSFMDIKILQFWLL